MVIDAPAHGFALSPRHDEANKLIYFYMNISIEAEITSYAGSRGELAIARAPATSIQMPKQIYHTASYLAGYIHASAEQIPSQCNSICGPDATTSGVGLNLQMTALMNCSTGKIAATHQVNEVPLTSV